MDDLDRLKEVKVRIPVRYHIRLLSMKVLTGKPISDAVTEALDGYFAALRTSHPETGRRIEDAEHGAFDL